MTNTGRIIEEQKNYYLVATPHDTVRATLKGILKKDRKRLYTGDMVDIEITNRDTDECIITRVHDRTTILNRPPLANIEQILVICTWKEPQLDLAALDRLLVCISAYGLKAVLVFNKIDLIMPDERSGLDAIIGAYHRIGYDVMESSATKGTGIASILERCSNRVSALAGLSGVGKSALLSRLFPDREFAIGDVSGSTGRGTHTTTTVSLLALREGGFIADTPGLAFVDLPLIPEEDVAAYFPELERCIGACRFNNCIHENEPGCKVKELAGSGHITNWRLDHYIAIYKEMRERRRQYKEKPSR